MDELARFGIQFNYQTILRFGLQFCVFVVMIVGSLRLRGARPGEARAGYLLAIWLPPFLFLAGVIRDSVIVDALFFFSVCVALRAFGKFPPVRSVSRGVDLTEMGRPND